MSKATILKQTVTEQDVLDAIAVFDRQHQPDYEYEEWWRTAYRRYALKHSGRQYPPRLVLSRAAGIPCADLDCCEQTNQILRQLGFEVSEKY